MTEDEKAVYRGIYDETRQFIQHGEEFQKQLSSKPQSDGRDALLASTARLLYGLRKEAEILERLGWGEDS